jgi:outer membrane protein TolC
VLLAGSLAAGEPPVEAPLPIDIATALRLVDANSPTVAVARARVQEAIARQQQANVLWLPNLQVGATYLRHDGQIQDTGGTVFTTSRQSLFAGGAAILRVDTADAYFQPLIARRLLAADSANARAVSNNVQLDVALTYLDLLRVNGQLAINADIVARAEEMLRRADAADRAGLVKTKADAPRARTEVDLRKQEALDIQGRVAGVSARLAQLLILSPTVDLLPVDPIVPVTLVSPSCSLNELVATGWLNRPELAAYRSLVAAAAERVRQAKYTPLLPKLQLDYSGGGYGGGRNDQLTNFGGRGDLGASAYWEFRNLGFGNVAVTREREAQLVGAQFRVQELQAQVAAEVTAAAKQTLLHFRALDSAQEAVRQALEMYRRLEASSFGMIGPKAQYDALEPLLAIQALNQARNQYLAEVIDYNKSQFRLYVALGQPAECALPGATPHSVETPVVPPAPAANSR